MRCFVVLGNARSGTSILAGMLDALGVLMGGEDNPSEQNPRGSFEDPEFIRITSELHRGDCKPAVARTQFHDLVSERSAAGVDWGFKSALSHEVSRHLDLGILPDPTFLVNFRNPVSNARSWVRHMDVRYGERRSFLEAIGRAVDGQSKLKCLLQSLPGEIAVFEHEQTVLDPETACRRIGDLCGRDPGPARRFVMPGYSSMSPAGAGAGPVCDVQRRDSARGESTAPEIWNPSN